MEIKEVISMLNSISDISEGSNLLYRFDNNVTPEKPITIRHAFTDKRMAQFYYSVLKNVPNTECELVESHKIITESIPYIEDDEIHYRYNSSHSVWTYWFTFKSTLSLITGNKNGN